MIYGTEGNDVIYGYSKMSQYDNSKETFYAGAGNDTVYGKEGSDIIYGEAGSDSLYGGNGDDVLVGGTGNDYLSGDYGNDTYVFNLGDGQDTICEYESSATSGKADKIVFGEGIKEEDVKLHRAGNNLIIRYSDKDQVTVKDAYYYGDDRTQIENIELTESGLYILNYDKLELELIKSCVYESDEVNYNQVVENMELMCVISENSLTNIDVESTIQEQIVDESNMAESIDCESEMMSSEIEGMANLLVQEMAEFQTGNIVYDTQSISTTENNENVQLWTQD